jgi:hypothetical protein
VRHRKSEFDSRASPALLGIFSHWQSSDRRVGMRFHCGWLTSREETLGFDAAPTGGGHTSRAVFGNLHSTGVKAAADQDTLDSS